MAPAAAIGTVASGSIRPASGPTPLPQLRRRNSCPCLSLSRVPYYMTRRTPSHPRLILIGHQTRPHGVLPEVVYGDPLPEEARRP